jgi:signal transduction histidine kinase
MRIILSVAVISWFARRLHKAPHEFESDSRVWEQFEELVDWTLWRFSKSARIQERKQHCSGGIMPCLSFPAIKSVGTSSSHQTEGPHFEVAHFKGDNILDLQPEGEVLEGLSKVARGFAHDARHYLSTIYANVELMSYRNVSRRTREELAEDVREIIADMTRMLDSILLHSETGSLPHRMEDMNEIAWHVVKMAQSHPDGRDVDFCVDESPRCRHRANRPSLCSALFNLVLNSCQAMKRTGTKGRVAVSVAAEGNWTVFRVKDNGPGVPSSVRNALSKVSLQNVFPGHGHGLAIVQQAARHHEGVLVLEESEPGRTVFALMLPSARLSFT